MTPFDDAQEKLRQAQDRPAGKTIYRPAAGRRIRHPDGRVMAKRGEAIILTPYFARLLRDGDIEPVPTRQAPQKKSSRSKQA